MKRRFNSLRLHVKKIGLFPTLSYLIQRLLLPTGKIIKIHLEGLPKPVFLRNKTYDTHTFYQIFIKEDLGFFSLEKPNVIFDLGANIGLSALYLIRKFENVTIYSVEPEFSNFNLLVKNTIGYKNIKPIQAAIWPHHTKLEIIDEGKGNASYMTMECNNSNRLNQSIAAMTIFDLIKMAGFQMIDLIKIDIEGSEFQLFLGDISLWIPFVKNIAVEIHELLQPGTSDLIVSKLGTSGEYFEETEYSFFCLAK